jgi:hypothetical protein
MPEPETSVDIADVIRNFGQAMGARLIPEGTSPELADLLPTETDAELAKLGAELAAQIAALDNPTETDAAKPTGEIARPLDYPVPATPSELLARVKRLSKPWQRRYWEIVSRRSGGRFPARESDAPGVAWSGAGMPQLPRDQGAYITGQRQHRAGSAEREPNRAPHRSPSATPGTAGGQRTVAMGSVS